MLAEPTAQSGCTGHGLQHKPLRRLRHLRLLLQNADNGAAAHATDGNAVSFAGAKHR